MSNLEKDPPLLACANARAEATTTARTEVTAAAQTRSATENQPGAGAGATADAAQAGDIAAGQAGATAEDQATAGAGAAAQDGPGDVVIRPRDVPLGGLRAMNVRRTLPARERSLIGAWCFLDHYGPDDVSRTGGMNVPAHPHTGLQTVSWLFTGEIDHRDSAGHAARVRPGELNLMTAGRGINHSEFTAPGTTILHGCQLWVALPDGSRFTNPGFEHYAPEPLELPGATVRVFLGSLLGETSPVTAFSPLLGAEILLDDGATLDLPLNPGFEHGVLVDQMPSDGVVEGAAESGVVGLSVEGGAAREVRPSELAAVDAGPARMALSARGGPARLLLLGGEPFGEEILMWWNFVGRTHDEVAAFRAEWQEEIGARQAENGAEPPGTAPRGGGPEHDDGGRPQHDPEKRRYGSPVTEETIPAPELPKVRLRTRGNRVRSGAGRVREDGAGHGGDRNTRPTGDHGAGPGGKRDAGQNGDGS